MPIATPMAVIITISRSTIQTIWPPRGAERHADADLAGAPRDVEGDGPVEADARDDQRQRRETVQSRASVISVLIA